MTSVARPPHRVGARAAALFAVVAAVALLLGPPCLDGMSVGMNAGHGVGLSAAGVAAPVAVAVEVSPAMPGWPAPGSLLGLCLLVAVGVIAGLVALRPGTVVTGSPRSANPAGRTPGRLLGWTPGLAQLCILRT